MKLIDAAEQRSNRRLWGIVGVFGEVPLGIYSLGGWFRQGGTLGGEIRGRLIDEFGDSEIAGKFFPEQLLEFEKHYVRRGETFNCNLKYKNGIWIGEYSGTGKDTRKGPIEAKITPVSSTSHCL